MYRRTFNKILTAGLVLPSIALNKSYAKEKNHKIMMLNYVSDENNNNSSNGRKDHDYSISSMYIFSPNILEVKPGDSVTFVPKNKGHNSVSNEGMIPEGSKSWRSDFDKEFTISLTKPGVYGYHCDPHYLMGMVGLIVVRNNTTDKLPNLDSAKSIKHPGMAGQVFKKLFSVLENNS